MATPKTARQRIDTIVETLDDAFGDLMTSNPSAFRTKYRKMAADPHSFYRGTACLFYADVTADEDPFCDERSGRIWIQGDLHVENFGTYLDSDGQMVFDVNDFDEAYLGRFTWDLQRLAASLALTGWQKALPEEEVRRLIGRYLRAYLAQIDRYRGQTDDDEFALHLGNTEGEVREVLQKARTHTRSGLLGAQTQIDRDGRRQFSDADPTIRRLSRTERSTVERAFQRYLETIPTDKRQDRPHFYDVLDIAGKSGFGIGSAGLPAYSILIEGWSQALENDVLLSMKQANVPAVSRFVPHEDIEEYFENQGHRCVVSQRALQVHADPLLGWTSIEGRGFMVSEVSPYEVDLEWDGLIEPDAIADVVDLLGQATAKIHCASDADSDQDLVDFQVEDAVAGCLQSRRREFVSWVTDFGVAYAEQVRGDHALFVEAFRSGSIGGVSAT